MDGTHSSAHAAAPNEANDAALTPASAPDHVKPHTPNAMRTKILESAYGQVQEGGLSALSIRAVAKRCQISVGTIYNYFPDKAALVTALITKFWQSVAFSSKTHSCFAYTLGEDFISYLKRIEDQIGQALLQFRHNWLSDMSSLDARCRHEGKQAEQVWFNHIYENLEKVLLADPKINQDQVKLMGAKRLSHFVWDSLYLSLKEKRSSEVLFCLLEQALYR